MLTEQYTKTPINTKICADILNEAGQKMFKAQYREATTYLVTRTGWLRQGLSSGTPQATVSGDKISAVFNYPKHIRFLDFKRGRSKRKKKNYVPIYNKYVFGYMMGYAYDRLSAGLSAYIRSAMYWELSSINNHRK